jgi:3-hydroxyisobutyrate dehydrogenase
MFRKLLTFPIEGVMNTMKAGFIGLGLLGRAMVHRLVSEGVEITAWNRTNGKADGLDVKVADSPSAVVRATDVILMCIFDSNAVREVLTKPDGLLAGDCKGKTIVDMTTNHFGAVDEFYRLCDEKGAIYIESPVLGSVVPASQGKLTIVVSGSKQGFGTAQPYLEKLGANIFHLETPGLASKMKVINNLALGAYMATISETLLLAEKSGISKADALDIFAVGAPNSAVLNAKRQKLLDEDFSPHFSVALIHKDLGCLQDLTKELGYDSQLAKIVRDDFGRGMSDDRKDLDFAAVYQLLKEG